MTKVSIVDLIAKKMKRCIAIVEDGDTASQSIASGKFVIWKGNPYKASAAISSGDTLSSSNLTALSDGIGNELNSNISTLNTTFSASANYSGTRNTSLVSAIEGFVRKSYKTVSGYLVITPSGDISASNQVLVTNLPNAANNYVQLLALPLSGDNMGRVTRVRITTEGTITTWYGDKLISGKAVLIQVNYICT